MTPDAIRAARKALGLTQAEFAAALGVRRDHIAKLEGGSKVPSPTLVKLIEAYQRHGLPDA